MNHLNWNLRTRPAYPNEYEGRSYPLPADGIEILPSQKIMKAHGRMRTYRRKLYGGNPELQKVIDETPLSPNLTVNPNSKFMVITYWWGRGNMNKNLQKPCPEDILEPIKEEMEEVLNEEDQEFAAVYTQIGELNTIRKSGGLNPEQKEQYKNAIKRKNEIASKLFARDDIKAEIVKRYNAKVEELRSAGQFTEPRTFDMMIKEWEDACKKVNCNYMGTEYSFFAKPGNYQKAINAKPMFIKKALDVAEGRGVLYIDGDMFINQYPAIFDTPNVDFMARGWNVDPRASMLYKTSVCFDPYIFETSGGTMYFANTDNSRRLLDAWIEASARPENAGKADDRILSMVFTERAFAMSMNLIQLPIEYLWLTDLYQWQDPADARRDLAIIEHPACLTGEERASDQGASTNRTPPGYERIEEAIECERRGGIFYEHIFFPTKEMVETFRPYIEYMKRAVNADGTPMFTVVDFDDKYGVNNKIAFKNLNEAQEVTLLADEDQTADLPVNAPIKDILGHLLKRRNVRIGGATAIPPKDTEFLARNIGPPNDPYLVKLLLDVNSPMFISYKNPIIHHLLAMCETLADINKHLIESYVFLSRIRWNLGTIQQEQKRAKTYRRKVVPFME